MKQLMSELEHIISIHALAKRATTYPATFSAVVGISIHALAKRATRNRKRHTPRPCISIHALAKRATLGVEGNTGYSYDFNPRPRKEGDHRPVSVNEAFELFQSTPSQRGRHSNLCLRLEG